MAREQLPKNINITSFTTTPVQISAVQLLATSFIVQAPSTNTDFVRIGNSTGQFFNLAPGRDFQVNGDNLDLGTTAYSNLQNWYLVAVSGIQNANVVYLERF